MQDDFRHTPELDRALGPLDAAALGIVPPGAGGAEGLVRTPGVWQGPGSVHPSPSGSLSLAVSPASLPGAESMELATAMSLDMVGAPPQDAGGATDDFDELARQEELSGVLMGEQRAGASGLLTSFHSAQLCLHHLCACYYDVVYQRL